MADYGIEKDYFVMSKEEQMRDLFNRQKQMLDMFLERNAISKAEYDKSLNGLKEKMGIDSYEE